MTTTNANANKGRDRSVSNNDLFDDNEPFEQKPAPVKKFLTRGGGTGGGKGNIGQKKEAPAQAQTQQQQQLGSATPKEEKHVKWKTQEQAPPQEKKELPKPKFAQKQQIQKESSDESDEEEEVVRKNERTRADAPTFANDSFDYNKRKDSPQLSDKEESSPKYAFDDECSWNTTFNKRNTQNNERKSAISKPSYANSFDANEETQQPQQQHQPKQSALVQKYFNLGQEKNAKQAKLEKQAEEAQAKQVESELQKMVNDKIEALNAEIAKFKAENDKVKRMRQKQEDMMKNLNKEMEDFQKKKEQEEKEFEVYKEEELKKIRKEKKITQKHFQAIANIPNRKEREEIEALKEQLSKAQEELKARDQRNKLVIERMRKQIEELSTRNAELQQEVKLLEQYRIKSEQTSKPGKMSVNKSQQVLKSVEVIKEVQKPKQTAMGKNMKGYNQYMKEEDSDEEENHYDEEGEENDSEHEQSDDQGENNEEELENDEGETYEDILNPNVKNYYDRGMPVKRRNQSEVEIGKQASRITLENHKAMNQSVEYTNSRKQSMQPEFNK